MVTEARDRGLPAYAETCPQYLFLSYDNYEEPGFDGAKYVMSPPLRPKETQDQAVARARVQRSAGDLDRPLPVLHEGTEGARPRRLLEDPERRAGHRDAHEPGLRRRRAHRAASRSIAGSSSRRRRRRRSSACSRARARSRPAPTPTSSSSIRTSSRRCRSKTLHMKVDYNPYEGRDGAGRQRDRDLARQGHHRERAVRRPRGRRVVHEAKPAKLNSAA